MFRRVLLPHDGSEACDRMLRRVRPLLAPDATVQLLSVVVEAGGMAAVEERADAAQGHLERLRDELVDAGLRGEVALVRGDPADGVLEAAARLDADLVAMATHGRSGPSRWLQGSVAEAVARRCPAPVLLANPDALDGQELRRLLVPVAGATLPAAPVLERLAVGCGAEVVLLTVAEPAPSVSAAAPMVVAPPAAQLEEALEGPRRALERAGVRARTAVAYGPAVPQVLAASEREGADLIVMASHGRKGLERWALGSVTEEVVRHGRRPVLVVRAGS
ncbi:MAG: universal stress protein [Planctomycetes bacterium]|nr:universal stress protein [Planctomycetota bacterium]